MFYEDTMNQYYCYVLDEKGRVESYEKDDLIVEVFKSEEELLQNFLINIQKSTNNIKWLEHRYI